MKGGKTGKMARRKNVSAKLFNKIKKALGERYDPSDDELINLYCETFEFYQRLRDEIENSDLLIEHTNKAGATNLVKNPLSIELTKTVQTLNNLLKSLGLTAAQRKKVVNDDADEFDDF
jgi:P27 family predicted phage terminase small subunit